MNPILAFISSHLITLLEYEIAKAAPEIASLIEQEMHLLINKIENLLSTKSKSVAAIAVPVLNKLDVIAGTALDAAASAAVNSSQGA